MLDYGWLYCSDVIFAGIALLLCNSASYIFVLFTSSSPFGDLFLYYCQISVFKCCVFTSCFKFNVYKFHQKPHLDRSKAVILFWLYFIAIVQLLYCTIFKLKFRNIKDAEDKSTRNSITWFYIHFILYFYCIQNNVNKRTESVSKLIDMKW